MATVLSALASPQAWPTSALVLLLSTVVFALSRFFSRPAWPSTAPKLINGLPIIGSPGFFTSRLSFLRKGSSASKTGNFSFFYGPHQIVALTGAAARATVFTSRSLDMNDGYEALFAGSASIDYLYEGEGKVIHHFLSLFKRFTKKDRLENNLPSMVDDVVAACQRIDTNVPMDPFDVLYKLIYQLTHRTLGSNDVANDPKLLKETLAIYTNLDDTSAMQIMFPWFPVPSKLRKMWAGARLHWAFERIMNDRRKTGRVENDAMQELMDAGDKDIIISSFIMAALFAGLINSGVNMAWIVLYLGKNDYWMKQVREEIANSIAKHRQSPQETPVETLSNLTMQQWETEFPKVDLCLRESIRLVTPGTVFRKNTSGKDVSIGGTSEIIPKESFAVYPLADVHFNPDIYTNPHEFDPSRYLPDRAEDQKQEQAYVGWGTGMHPCLGMRFAKLEITIATVIFLASFDYKVCDKKGNTKGVELPFVDHERPSAQNHPGKVYLKCESRF